MRSSSDICFTRRWSPTQPPTTPTTNAIKGVLTIAKIGGGSVDPGSSPQDDVARNGRFMINTALDDAVAPLAVVRLLEIIGEAAARVPAEERAGGHVQSNSQGSRRALKERPPAAGTAPQSR